MTIGKTKIKGPAHNRSEGSAANTKESTSKQRENVCSGSATQQALDRAMGKVKEVACQHGADCRVSGTIMAT
jgi:hypothetical protein